MANNMHKGNRVRFRLREYDVALRSSLIIAERLKAMDKDKTYIVLEAYDDGNIRLEGYSFPLSSHLFYRLCSICQEKEVFSKKDFDKCLGCAGEESVRLRKEFEAALAPDQARLFEAYRKADSDFTSMVILD